MTTFNFKNVERVQKYIFSQGVRVITFLFPFCILLCVQTGAREECTSEKTEGSRCDC